MESFQLPATVEGFLDALAQSELPSGIPFKESVIGFLVFVFLFETYLEFRQLSALRKKTVPDSLKDVISEKSFLSTQAYAIDKWHFAMFLTIFSLAEELLIIHFNVLAMLWDWTPTPVKFIGYFSPENEILRSVIFTVVFSVVTALIKMPFNLYSTFVLEEKHGFNKQTVRLFIMDLLKSFMLMLIFVPLLLSAIIPIIHYGGRLLAFWMWLFMFSFSLIAMTLYPTIIAPLFNKYDPLPEGPLREKIEALAASLNFPLKKLYVVDGSTRSAHSNAYMYGFFKNKRIVLFDTLIKQCEGHDEEIVAVLAHELGHWKLNHTVFTFTTMQLVTIIQMSTFMVVRNTAALYTCFGFTEQPALVSLLLFQQIIAPVDHLVGFFFNVLSRRFEFQADAFAVGLNYADSLRGGLIRLQETNKSSSNIDPWYSAYHHTHPPLVERLKALHLKKE